MPKVLDPFRFVLLAVAGWMNQRQLHIIDYLRHTTSNRPSALLASRSIGSDTFGLIRCTLLYVSRFGIPLASSRLASYGEH